jgi:hypothetical protein
LPGDGGTCKQEFLTSYLQRGPSTTVAKSKEKY